MSDVLTRGGVALEERLSDGDTDSLGDWFAIKIEREAWGCGELREYVADDSCPHPIVVWPEENDPNLLRVMNERAKSGPTAIVPYEMALGDCISWYACSPS